MRRQNTGWDALPVQVCSGAKALQVAWRVQYRSPNSRWACPSGLEPPPRSFHANKGLLWSVRVFDAKTISDVIGREAFETINASNLPKQETMTLLHVWAVGSAKKLRAMAEAGELVPVLKKQHRAALDEANETRLANSHLTVTECLQKAGLPLVLPHTQAGPS